MHLSLVGQVSLSLDKPAISPTYVFGGQHSPIVVRLAESLWATGLSGSGMVSTGGPLSGPELLSKQQLIRALTLLHTDERCESLLWPLCIFEYCLCVHFSNFLDIWSFLRVAFSNWFISCVVSKR